MLVMPDEYTLLKLGVCEYSTFRIFIYNCLLFDSIRIVILRLFEVFELSENKYSQCTIQRRINNSPIKFLYALSHHTVALQQSCLSNFAAVANV